MSAATLLTNELLSVFEAELRAANVPVIEHWAQGRPADQIVDLLAPLGVDPTAELLTWWQWHDGVRARSELPSVGSELAPDVAFMTVEDCLNQYRSFRKVASMGATDDFSADYWYEPSWIPLLECTSGAIVADSALGETSPLRLVDYPSQSEGQFRHVGAASIGAAVEWWTDGLRTGRWSVDPSGMRWNADYAIADDRLPLDQGPSD